MPTKISINISVPSLDMFPGGGDDPTIDFLLLEIGDMLLLEDGASFLILE